MSLPFSKRFTTEGSIQQSAGDHHQAEDHADCHDAQGRPSLSHTRKNTAIGVVCESESRYGPMGGTRRFRVLSLVTRS